MNLTPKEKKKNSSENYAASCPAVTHGLVLSFNHAWMLKYMNGASLPKANKCPERKIKWGALKM